MNFDNIKLASLPRRGIAFFIDELLLSFLIVFIFWEQVSLVSGDEEALVALTLSMTVPYAILKVVYHAFFIGAYGATLGKMVVKIKCVNYQNEKPEFKEATLRSFVRIFSEMIFYLGFIWAALNPTSQTWHDKLSKILVIDAV